MPRGKDTRPVHPCPRCGRMIVRDQSHRCHGRRLQCRECGAMRVVDHSRRCHVCAAAPYRSLTGGIARPSDADREPLVAYYHWRAGRHLELFSDPAGRTLFLRAKAEQRAAAAPAASQDAQTFLAALCRQTQDALERPEPVRTRD